MSTRHRNKALIVDKKSAAEWHLTVQESSVNALNMLLDHFEMICAEVPAGKTASILLDISAVQALPMQHFIKRVELAQNNISTQRMPALRVAIVYRIATPFMHAFAIFLRKKNPVRVKVHFYNRDCIYQARDWLTAKA